MIYKNTILIVKSRDELDNNVVCSLIDSNDKEFMGYELIQITLPKRNIYNYIKKNGEPNVVYLSRNLLEMVDVNDLRQEFNIPVIVFDSMYLQIINSYEKRWSNKPYFMDEMIASDIKNNFKDIEMLKVDMDAISVDKITGNEYASKSRKEPGVFYIADKEDYTKMLDALKKGIRGKCVIFRSMMKEFKEGIDIFEGEIKDAKCLLREINNNMDNRGV